jgi:hypothetical protein
MSERDQFPVPPRPEAPAQPRAEWQTDSTPGLRSSERHPFSGAGASAAGTGEPTGGRTDTVVGDGTAGYARQGEGFERHDGEDRQHTAPEYSTAPVTVRRPDVLAALLLIVAGIAAAASLLLEWATDSKGWNLVRDGFEDFDTGSWQPPVIVLAGGVLLVLGLLMLLPARSHRTLGVLALLATMAAAGGVLVVLDESQWTWDFFEVGFWVAAAVPVLGLVGSLKAMLTSPRVR